MIVRQACGRLTAVAARQRSLLPPAPLAWAAATAAAAAPRGVGVGAAAAAAAAATDVFHHGSEPPSPCFCYHQQRRYAYVAAAGGARRGALTTPAAAGIGRSAGAVGFGARPAPAGGRANSSSSSSDGNSPSTSSSGTTTNSSGGTGGGTGGGGGSMYDDPTLYDEVFAYRDFAAEAAFVRAAYARHCPGRPLAALVDLGCGPARHAELLAKGGGSSGGGGACKVYALDASAAMLEHAERRARAAGVGADALAFVRGDMAAFEIPEVVGKADAVTCLLGTLSHMETNDAALAAFGCAARHLRPGGMLLVELAHPGDLFDGSLMLGDAGAGGDDDDGAGGEMWEAESPSRGGRLLVEWGAPGDDFDPATQVLSRTVTVRALGPDGEPDDGAPLVHESTVRQRAFTLQELDLLGRAAGLRLAASYGDLDTGVGLTHEDAYRLVACFVKQP